MLAWKNLGVDENVVYCRSTQASSLDLYRDSDYCTNKGMRTMHGFIRYFGWAPHDACRL